MFETQRLRLREYRPTDEDFFIAMHSDFDFQVNITMGFVAPNRDKILDLIKKQCALPLFVVAESKETGKQVGFVNLQIAVPQNLDGTLGLGIAKEWWGKGYGTEILTWLIGYSFKTLGLRRLSLGVFGSNPRAVSLYERVGFKLEGRQREALWKEGKWVDMIMMAILAREYRPEAHKDAIHESNAPASLVVESTGGERQAETML